MRLSFTSKVRAFSPYRTRKILLVGTFLLGALCSPLVLITSPTWRYCSYHRKREPHAPRVECTECTSTRIRKLAFSTYRKVWKYVEISLSYVHVFLCFYRHFWLGKHFDFVPRISFSIPNYFSFEVSVLKLLFGWFEAFWMKVWNDEVMMTKIYMTRFSLTLNHTLWWGFPRILIWLTYLHNFLITFLRGYLMDCLTNRTIYKSIHLACSTVHWLWKLFLPFLLIYIISISINIMLRFRYA